jgi:hypothetical protein
MKRTSTQQRRAFVGPHRRRRNGRTPALAAPVPVPVAVNETKVAIVAVMGELGRPVSSTELQGVWAELKSLSIFEYHLATLVSARVAEMVIDGPEMRFCLSKGN